METENPNPVVAVKIETEDYVRIAFNNPAIMVDEEQAKKLIKIAFNNMGDDVPYDVFLETFIHRLGGDFNALERYKGTEFEDIIQLLPLISKKITEFRAQKGK